MSTARPLNIVYLHAHDAGRWVQPYGYPVETPNLMRFAKEAVLFRKAFCTTPTCAPSRVSLSSSQYPHQLGMYGLPHEGWRYADFSHHWVRILRSWGYETALAGVQHECIRADLPELGYEKLLDTRPKTGEFYQETIDHVERFLAVREDPRPFFLSIGIDEPHRDNLTRPEINLHGKSDRFSKTRFYDPKKLDGRYTAPPPWLPDLPEIRQDMESYREGVKLMDEYMGRVLYVLDHMGYRDNTLVIITADHGIEFPGGKMTLGDQGLQVMLMMRGPADTPFHGGRVVEPLVSHLDVLPTVCELLGKPAPHSFEGKSLVPLARGDVPALHECVFAELTHHGDRGPEPLRAVRTERYKLVRRHLDVSNIMWHDGPTTPVMRAAGWYKRANAPKEELFDLYLDPMEACNRIDDPALQEVRKELGARLDAWMARTGDPFPTGVFPPPPPKAA